MNYYRAETKLDIHLSKDGNDDVKQGCHMGPQKQPCNFGQIFKKTTFTKTLI